MRKQKRKELPIDIKIVFTVIVLWIITLFAMMFVGTADGEMYLNDKQEVCGYKWPLDYTCSSQLQAYKDIMWNTCENNQEYAKENLNVCEKIWDMRFMGEKTWIWDWILQDYSNAWTDWEFIFAKSK